LVDARREARRASGAIRDALRGASREATSNGQSSFSSDPLGWTKSRGTLGDWGGGVASGCGWDEADVRPWANAEGRGGASAWAWGSPAAADALLARLAGDADATVVARPDMVMGTWEWFGDFEGARCRRIDPRVEERGG